MLEVEPKLDTVVGNSDVVGLGKTVGMIDIVDRAENRVWEPVVCVVKVDDEGNKPAEDSELVLRVEGARR